MFFAFNNMIIPALDPLIDLSDIGKFLEKGERARRKEWKMFLTSADPDYP